MKGPPPGSDDGYEVGHAEAAGAEPGPGDSAGEEAGRTESDGGRSAAVEAHGTEPIGTAAPGAPPGGDQLDAAESPGAEPGGGESGHAEPGRAEPGRPEPVTAESRPSGVFLRAGLLLLVAFVLLVLVTFVRREAVYRIEATTESLELAIRSSQASALAGLEWEIPAAGDSVLANDSVFVFAGRAELAAGARVVMGQRGTGPLYVEIRAPSDTGLAAVLKVFDDPLLTAHGLFVLQAEPRDDRPYTFPYFGTARIGHVIQSGGSDLLMEGTVSILGRTFLGGDRFVAATIPLQMGDEVQIMGPKPSLRSRLRSLLRSLVERGDGQQGTDAGGSSDCGPGPSGAIGVGVVRADTRPGMTVVHEAQGRALRISRAGAKPHCFRASLWSFLAADPLLGGVLLFGVGVLIAVGKDLIGFALFGLRPRRR